MLLTWLSRLHLVTGLLVGLFLVAAIGFAAGDGFQPARDRYAPNKALNATSATRYVLSLFPRPAGRHILILDSNRPEDFTEEGGASEYGLNALEERLGKAGMVVTRTRGAAALPLAKDVDVLLLAHALPQYSNLDPHELAAVMRSPLVVDNCGGWASQKFDEAGLLYLNAARLFWPHWMDPEMESFAAYVRETVPKNDGILMVPKAHLTSTASRARWFLPLNVRLLPRRLYLWRPELGTSFVTTYYEWVEAYQEHAPWKKTERIRLQKRGLSKMLPSSPTRTLTEEERQAAITHNVQWVLFWDHQPDFNLKDWELVPLDEVLSWGIGRSGVPR